MAASQAGEDRSAWVNWQVKPRGLEIYPPPGFIDQTWTEINPYILASLPALSQRSGQLSIATAQVQYTARPGQVFQNPSDAGLKTPASSGELECKGLVKLTVEVEQSLSCGSIHEGYYKWIPII